MDSMNLVCRRCDLPVVVSAEYYETFERMHWTCFHFEFEHYDRTPKGHVVTSRDEWLLDPDASCGLTGCPSESSHPRR